MPAPAEVQSVDPRTGEPFGMPWPTTGDDEVNAVCEAATGAAEAVRRSTPEERASWLAHVARALEADRATLVAIADRECGLGERRLNGELTRTTFQLGLLAEAAVGGHHLDVTIDPPTSSPMGPLPDLRRTAVPLGPVAVFTASNFPFAFGVPGGDTASALAAGCPVVVKTHPSHPGLSAELARVVAHALERAGAPRGVFASVSGVAAGRRLITHPAIRAAAFTGSLAGGRALLDLANSRPDPIPFYGELGSLNPVVVTPAAAMARAAEIGRSWVESMTLGGGQFCTKPGLLLVPSAAADDVVGAAAAALAEVSAPVLLNTAIRDRFDGGVDLLRGYGRELLCAEASFLEGLAVQPVVACRTAQETLQQPHVLDEVFGPVGIVVEYTGFDEVVAVLGRIGGSLTVTVHGEQDDPDASGAVELAASMAGRVVWNGFPTGVAVSRSMQHGGPWPASTASRDTSVGSAAIRRFVRPVTYQGLPDALLPPELRTP